MAQVRCRVDDVVIVKAESACATMGLTMSDAINIFLTKVAIEQKLPFEKSEVSLASSYSEEYFATLECRIAEMKEGKKVHEHDLIEVDDAADMT